MIDNKLLKGILIGFLATFAAFSILASESLQTNQTLEQRVSALENRVTELEKISQPSQRQTQAPSTNAWRQLENGMSMAQVRELLGEPDRVSASGSLTIWNYAGLRRGTVTFSNQRLHGWSE